MNNKEIRRTLHDILDEIPDEGLHTVHMILAAMQQGIIRTQKETEKLYSSTEKRGIN